MKTVILRSLLLILLLFLKDDLTVSRPSFVGECTIGIFSGRATSDGRPLLWKNRDVTNAVQKFCYYTRVVVDGDTTMAYTGNTYSNDTTRVYMGLNEAGFAVMNSNTYNLNDYMRDGIDDGAIMAFALERCRTLADFERLLDATSIIGRKDCWNFGAIDAYGNAAFYECGNNTYTKYDANDTLMEASGAVLRATFSFSGGDSLDGFARYKRATQLVTERLRQEPVDVSFILNTLARDLNNPIDNPYPLPYHGSQNGRPAGFILSRNITINRDITRSLVVIRGIRPGENPKLATIYGMIGPPVLSVAYPMWVESQAVPAVLNNGANVPMFSRISQRIPRLYPIPGDNTYLNSRYLIGKDGVGIYTYTLPLENRVIQMIEGLLNSWRYEIPERADFLAAQNALADTIYSAYLQIPIDFAADIDQPLAAESKLMAYPNPFNASTTIDVSEFDDGRPLVITIYNLLGQEVRRIESSEIAGGSIIWDGRDDNNVGLSSGVYLINAAGYERAATVKVLLLK